MIDNKQEVLFFNEDIKSLNKKIYADFDISFYRNPFTSTISTKIDAEAIKQSIRNIILTNKGERPFEPNFGSNLRRYLFENFSLITKDQIETEIRTAINTFEPRVIIADLEVKDFPERNAINIHLVVLIKQIKERAAIDFLVKRLR
jgi:phage baseplate assembly protein W